MARTFAFTRRAMLATVAAGVGAPLLAQAPVSYRDAKAPIEARVRDLLGRMTVEEKAAQLRCAWFGKSGFLGADGSFSAEKAAKSLANGIGQVARPGDWAGTGKYLGAPFRDAASTVALVNAIQRFHVEQTRLGIPTLFHEEVAHGLMASEATVFPIPPAS